MSEKIDSSVDELVASHRLEIERLKSALALLGVRDCLRCKKFYRRADPGTLFDAGQLVCYWCLQDWWAEESPNWDSKDRTNVEGKLVFWLREERKAELFKDPAKLPESSLQEFCMTANCLECRGTGKMLGDERCRYCEGRGTVWVVVARKK
ncbi:MAG: hypothetical protein WBV69_16535 [Candidatus Sulfotelmatobacter sp.]